MQLMRSRFRPPFPGAGSSAVDGESEPGGGALMGAVPANKLVGEAIAETWRKVKLGPLTRRVFTGWLAVTLGTSKVEPAKGDKRFTDPAWQEHPGYRRLMQAYLVWAQAVTEALDAAEATEDWRVSERARFGLRILTSSLAPTNSPFTNPAVAKRAFETAGLSLWRGATHLWRDVVGNGGVPAQVERERFRVGEELAVTPGAVVYRHELFELLQYSPTTTTVHEVPLLVVPPVVNRFYFVDLSPGRSFVEHAVGQGFTVFLISWRHPGPGSGHLRLEDYTRAFLHARDVVAEITQEPEVNVFAVCTGGIVAAVGLAQEASKGDGPQARSLGLAVSMLTYDEPSAVGMVADPEVIDLLRGRAAAGNVIPARDIESGFGWLKPEDLVWGFLINDWLLGQDPPGGDVMAWSSDPAAAPAGLAADLLDISFGDLLRTSGGLEVSGTPIDLHRLTLDAFAVAGLTDHISPWKACYTATELLGGDTTFLLTNTAHVPTMVSPPDHRGARYFAGGDPGPDPDAWLAGAEEYQGSWWPIYTQWLRDRSGPMRRARRRLGSSRRPVLDPAPGQYVHEHEPRPKSPFTPLPAQPQ